MNDGPSWTDVLTAVGAWVAAIGAIVAALVAFYRRPSLSLHKDREKMSRVEGNGFPYIRLLVRNKGWRRIARGTRVFVARHQKQGASASDVTMGSPALAWTGVPVEQGNGADVFAGSERPIDFGYLIAAHRDRDGRVLIDDPDPATIINNGGKWQFRLALHNLCLVDQREFLAPTPEGYSVRLELGADDGKARKYDVHVNWGDSAEDAEAALESVQLYVFEA
jgi:hypothetical protein